MKSLTQHLKQFKAQGAGLFIPYVMAGDHPDGLAGLEETLQYLEQLGVSAIEVGVPFSDPVADGPVIQAAGIRALAHGTSLTKIIQQLKKSQVTTPLVIMTYFNPIFKYGIKRLVEDLQETSVKGLIIPDLPYEHREYLTPYLEESDIALVPLVSLTTRRDRMKLLADNGEGFVYAVAINGVTGTNTAYSEKLFEHLAYLSQVSSLPVLAGFGVSMFDEALRFNEVCDGVIIGSHVVSALHNGQTKALSALIKDIVAIRK
jgi:tryptophan synthase alpha chain